MPLSLKRKETLWVVSGRREIKSQNISTSWKVREREGGSEGWKRGSGEGEKGEGGKGREERREGGGEGGRRREWREEKGGRNGGERVCMPHNLDLMVGTAANKRGRNCTANT